MGPGPRKIEVSSLAPEHVINHGELQLPIRLSADWQSPIGPLSNQAKWLHLRHNSCFIFLFDILLHWCYGVGDVFNMKRSPSNFNFSLVYTGILSVGNWTFFNPIKIIHILFWLVMTFILYYWVIIWTTAEPIGRIFYKLKILELFWCDVRWREVNLVRALILVNPQLSWYDVNLIYCIIFIWCESDILHCLCLNLSWLRKNLS
jgi:hypothetical protein